MEAGTKALGGEGSLKEPSCVCDGAELFTDLIVFDPRYTLGQLMIYSDETISAALWTLIRGARDGVMPSQTFLNEPGAAKALMTCSLYITRGETLSRYVRYLVLASQDMDAAMKLVRADILKVLASILELKDEDMTRGVLTVLRNITATDAGISAVLESAALMGFICSLSQECVFHKKLGLRGTLHCLLSSIVAADAVLV